MKVSNIFNMSSNANWAFFTLFFWLLKLYKNSSKATKIPNGRDIAVSATVDLKCLVHSETPLAERDLTKAGVKLADGSMTACEWMNEKKKKLVFFKSTHFEYNAK